MTPRPIGSRGLLAVALALALAGGPPRDATAGAPEPEATARLSRAITAELERARDRDRGGEACLSIDDELPGDAKERARLLLSLARGAALLAGFDSMAPCAVARDPLLRDQAARRAGAEWRLALRLRGSGRGRVEISFELRAIDPGLWRPTRLPEDVPVVARDRAVISEEDLPRRLVSETPASGLRRTEVRRTSGPALALAACDLTGDGEPELVVVSDELLVLKPQRDGAPLARLAFDGLTPSEAPARDPIAGVVCGDLHPRAGTEIAFGHSSLAQGLLIEVQRSGGELRLAPIQALPGVPLTRRSDGAVFLAHADQGRNRWAAALVVWRSSEQSTRSLPQPFLDLAAVDGAPALLVLDEGYRVQRWDAALSRSETVGTSGVGVGTLSVGKAALLVTTSSRAGSSDLLHVGDSRLEVPGAIVATASWRPGPDRPGEIYVSARTAGGGGQLWRVVLPESR
ncbi:MAG: hypothetical protein IT384_17620 [Deltaproteobacteria bacterium]|nr:hypothetical protein [Deltaproteobacteria bacterium]